MKRHKRADAFCHEAFDRVDLVILDALQDNARTSNASLARRLGVAPSAVLQRIRKLEGREVLQGYAARIAPAKVGANLTAFVFVRTEQRNTAAVARQLVAQPSIQEVHHVAGEDCILIKLRTADTHALAELLGDKVHRLVGVLGTRTIIVLETMKESSALVLPGAARKERARPSRRGNRAAAAAQPRRTRVHD